MKVKDLIKYLADFNPNAEIGNKNWGIREMGRKKVHDEENTITITVRNINRDEWNDLSNYIGSRSKSDFIRECITNQINKQDSVTELKREISEIRYQIDTLNDKLETKEEELAKILKAQSDNFVEG